MKKGVTIYFSIVVMFMMLAIAMGLSSVIFYQIKMTKDASDSVIAFQAADTGVERGLYDCYKEGSGCQPTNKPGVRSADITLANGAVIYYNLYWDDVEKTKNIFSVGRFGKIKRALWVTWR